MHIIEIYEYDIENTEKILNFNKILLFEMYFLLLIILFSIKNIAIT